MADRIANGGMGPYSSYGNRPPLEEPMVFDEPIVEQEYMPLNVKIERFMAAGDRYKMWKKEMFDLGWPNERA